MEEFIDFRDYFEYDPTSPTMLVHAFTKNCKAKKGWKAGRVKEHYRGTKGIEITLNKKVYSGARVMWALITDGTLPPDDKVVICLDGDNYNIEPDNLALVSRQEMSYFNSLVTNKAAGVVQVASGAYIARLTKNGSQIYLGSFPTFEEAHEAYRRALASHVLRGAVCF